MGSRWVVLVLATASYNELQERIANSICNASPGNLANRSKRLWAARCLRVIMSTEKKWSLRCCTSDID